MTQYVDKSDIVMEIEKELNSCKLILMGNDYINVYEKGREDVCHKILSFINTLEMKEVIAEQECTCNEALNRIVGGSWNLICPVNKLGLKTGDKVKVIIKA